MSKTPLSDQPGIKELRSELESCSFGFCTDQVGSNQMTRKVDLRAEIDTSPPFGSVKEAVSRFGGSGSWNPFCKDIGEIDIKKVEEQAAELEKDLIVKELETLDVLEELGTTKRVVEELKQQIQKEALRRVAFVDEQMSSPAIKEMNKENCSFHVNNREQRIGTFSPCRTDSPDMILMELQQAKLNLGKTITDLGGIQTSVESLNKKIKKDKTSLEKARERLMSKFAGVLSLEEELKQERVKSHVIMNKETRYSASQLKKMIQPESAEVAKAMLNDQSKDNLKNAELRLFAARKMEEAARAAEAVGLAEMKALSSNENSSTTYALPEPKNVPSFEAQSLLTPKTQKLEGFIRKEVVSKLQNHEANIIKMSILKRLSEAAEEIKQSKQALEEAMNKIEMANRKQLAVEEALRKWMPEDDQESRTGYCDSRFSNFRFNQSDQLLGSPLNDTKYPNLVNSNSKPVLRSTTSMRDVLSKKQILPEEYVAARPMDGCAERQKVALSQMLYELRKDPTFHPRAEKEGSDQKQYFAQRRKFGFIHISLPITKPSKKKMPDLNNTMH